MTIMGYADSNEDKRILNILGKNGWMIKKLSAGDYMTNKFIFERKTPQDFIKSLYDNRYKKQLFKMEATGKKIIYIIEGNLKKGFLRWIGFAKPVYDHKKQETYIDVISSLQAKYDISVISTTTPQMTAKLLVAYGKKRTEPLTFDLFSIVESNIDGIGSKRLIDITTYISAKCGVPWNVMDNDDKITWLRSFRNGTYNIPGVGKKTFEKIIRYYEEKK